MDQDFYIEDSSPIKAIIAIIFFIGLIVASIYYFFNYRKENVVKLKDVTVELGELLPTDINTYIVSGNPDSYTIDLSNVSVDETGKTNSTGEYSYRIKKNSNIKKGKIYVKDTTKPEVEVEELTVGVNESFEVSEFVSECKDLSLPCNVKYKNIKDEDLNQKEGSYEVDIIITDSENNSITKSVRLNVSGTNTFAKKKEANLKFDHLSDDDSNWDKTYTLKLEKALNENSLEFHEKFDLISSKEYEFKKEVESKTILVAYNRYEYAIGFSIRITFKDGSVIYVTSSNATEKTTEN